jgi:hypothetical protein
LDTGFLGINQSPTRCLDPLVDDASNTSVTYVSRLTHTTSGTPTAGIGVGEEFVVETAAGNNEIGMTLEAVTTDVTSTSEDFDFVVNLMAAGATAAERFRIDSAGGLYIRDGITAPSTRSGYAIIYVDTSDGDLKVRFGDGTTKTIVVDT